MYNLNTIQDFLLKENLISPNAIVFGDFEATSINRRNQNIQITSINDQNLLIKQVQNQSSENAKTLKREIQFYDYAQSHFNEFKTFLAEVNYLNPNEIILILTLYPDALPLWKYYNLKTIENFPLRTTEMIGELMGSMHKVFTKQEILNDKRLDFLDDELPFIFKINKPHPNILSYLGGGGMEFIEHLQSQQDIMMAFNKIPEIWNKNALIHGDIKLDNFIVLDPERDVSQALKLVDWEMLQFGDYAWDLAGVFNDFIFWWVITMPDNESPENMVKNARFPFRKLQPGINAFWNSYAASLGLNEFESQDLLNKVMQLTGFRVLQTSYEISSKFEVIPSIAHVLLNMGKSIIRKPEFSQEKLFGITKIETVV